MDAKPETVVFVSEDLNHDASAMETFINGLIHHLKLQLPKLKKHSIWSDGCAAQYKSCQPFFNLSQMFGHQDVSLEWQFFGSRHGKNPSDG